MTDLMEHHISSLTCAFTSAVYRNAPIGVMDSGVGGFSILREIQTLLPYEDIVFIGDQGHVPYGPRSLAEVQAFVEGIVRFFISDHRKLNDPLLRRVKLIVLACNTASAASLHPLRQGFPQIKFVGLEPAIKPAAQKSHRRRIGVIATAATFQGQLYASLIDRYTQDVDVFTRACPEFVSLVERGGEFTAADKALVCEILQPLVDAGIDQLVLGCTHFPFLLPLLRQCLGDSVEIVDPSLAVARQVARVLETANALTDRTTPGQTLYTTTGDVPNFKRQIREMLGVTHPVLRQLMWLEDERLVAKG
jgi:glutamate racemase